MSSIRFLTSSDEHLADLNPGYRKDSYRDAILGKLEWQGELARKLECDAVHRGGDFIHVKAANKTTMGTLGKAAAIHRKYSCPTYSVCGNHDMSFNDPESIPRQPLGVLLKSGVFRPLKDERFVSGSMSVRVVGVDYTTDLGHETLKELVRKKDGDTYTIAIVHALAAFAPEERIQSFFNETVFDYRDLVFDGCPDVYVFGHYHKDQGVRELLGTKFVNLGAVSRGALTFENLERRPKVSSIACSSSGISIDVHEVPCRDASEVFDLDKKKEVERTRKNLDDFIRQLRSTTTEHTGLDEKLAHLRTSPDYPDDLRNVILSAMEAAETGDAET
jgi:DNA repair exonuclease SbcCD nuclease subunit